MTDMRLLKSKMVLADDSMQKLASWLNISRQTLAKKLNGKSQFTQREIDLIAIKYDLLPHEIQNIFFSKENQ